MSNLRSWAMVVGIAADLILNGCAFRIYFKRPAARLIIAVDAIILTLFPVLDFPCQR